VERIKGKDSIAVEKTGGVFNSVDLIL
jgi:hypothetical protein